VRRFFILDLARLNIAIHTILIRQLALNLIIFILDLVRQNIPLIATQFEIIFKTIIYLYASNEVFVFLFLSY